MARGRRGVRSGRSTCTTLWRLPPDPQRANDWPRRGGGEWGEKPGPVPVCRGLAFTLDGGPQWSGGFTPPRDPLGLSDTRKMCKHHAWDNRTWREAQLPDRLGRSGSVRGRKRHQTTESLPLNAPGTLHDSKHFRNGGSQPCQLGSSRGELRRLTRTLLRPCRTVVPGVPRACVRRRRLKGLTGRAACFIGGAWSRRAAPWLRGACPHHPCKTLNIFLGRGEGDVSFCTMNKPPAANSQLCRSSSL